MHQPHPSPTTTTTEATSILATLRHLIPDRMNISAREALRVAEIQAAKLLKLHDIDEPAIPSEVITSLPRIKVVSAELPVSGTSHWNGTTWIIALNLSESRGRRRFTLAHEFKHIIDHGYAKRLYAATSRSSADRLAEQAADYFAGCLLIPRRLLKRAWGNGLQDPVDLAAHFDVSIPAIHVRLAQTGLTEQVARCARGLPDSTETRPPQPMRSAA